MVLEKSGPAVRFLPTFFVLANLEDAFSQQLAAKLLLDKTEKLGVPMSHCFARLLMLQRGGVLMRQRRAQSQKYTDASSTHPGKYMHVLSLEGMNEVD